MEENKEKNVGQEIKNKKPKKKKEKPKWAYSEKVFLSILGT